MVHLAALACLHTMDSSVMTAVLLACRGETGGKKRKNLCPEDGKEGAGDEDKDRRYMCVCVCVCVEGHSACVKKAVLLCLESLAQDKVFHQSPRTTRTNGQGGLLLCGAYRRVGLLEPAGCSVQNNVVLHVCAHHAVSSETHSGNTSTIKEYIVK